MKTKEILEEMDPPERTCTGKDCVVKGQPQSIDQFRWVVARNQFTLTCEKCRKGARNAQEVWRNKYPEENKRTTVEWHKNNKERVSATQKRWRASLTPERRRLLNAKSSKVLRERIARMSPIEHRAYLDHRNVRRRRIAEEKKNA